MLHVHLVKPNVDLRQVTVLTAKDWQRIQDELHWKEIEAEKVRRWKERKERMKEKSENIVKNWPNSLMNLRQKKLDDIKKKKESAEERRKEMDLEWAEYQAALRKDIIEKAKEKQYYQTERVRNLHSAYLMTEVMKEREEQIKLKQMLADNDKIREKQWADKVKEENEKIMEIEKLRIMEIRKSLMEKAEFVKSQINRTLDLKEKEKDKMRKEQVELNKLAEQWRLEKEEQNKLHRENVKRSAMENRKQIEENEHIRKLQEQLEEEDNKQCRIYADAKRKLMKLRAAREKEIADERQKYLDFIVDKLSRNMQKKKDDEDERIAKAVAEMDAKQKAEEEEKERKRREVVAQCQQHLLEKKREDEQKKMELIKADREYLKDRMEADAICQKNDLEKMEKEKQGKLALRDYHKKQIEQKKLKEEELQEYNRKFNRAADDLKKQEEIQFQMYAQNLIKQSAQKGRNVYPLLAAACQNSTPPKSAPVKSISPNDDRKNLGFIW